MHTVIVMLIVAAGLAGCDPSLGSARAAGRPDGGPGVKVTLPPPRRDGGMALARALASRRSRREYRREPLALADLSQLLWAAQGISSAEGMRTAPSAGALFPLEIYVAVRRVAGLDAGVYHYRPTEHDLERVVAGDVAAELQQAAVNQKEVGGAAATMVVGAVVQRTARKYGEHATRYVHIEVGHAAQNVLLQATALGLGAVAIGAFHDGRVKSLLRMQAEPLYLVLLGR